VGRQLRNLYKVANFVSLAEPIQIIPKHQKRLSGPKIANVQGKKPQFPASVSGDSAIKFANK